MRKYLIYCITKTQYQRVRARCFSEDIEFISRKDVKIGNDADSYYILSNGVPKAMTKGDLVIIDLTEKKADDSGDDN